MKKNEKIPINLTDETYALLNSVKSPNERIRKAIKRLCSQYTAQNLKKWCLAHPPPKTIPEEAWIELEEIVSKIRKRPIIGKSIEL